MPKGKKFDAAEKHFLKKTEAIQKERDRYKNEMYQSADENTMLRKKISELEAELNKKDDWIERLLEYTNLSDEDIKKVCEMDKKRGESLDKFMSLINVLGGTTGISRYMG